MTVVEVEVTDSYVKLDSRSINGSTTIATMLSAVRRFKSDDSTSATITAE